MKHESEVLAKPIENLNGLAIYCFRPHQKIKHAKSDDTITHVLFSHANGVSARTYGHLLQKWANETGLVIYTYDVRGMGLSNRPVVAAYASGKQDVWRHLTRDLIEVFEDVCEREKKTTKQQWMFAGHSLGGWISLLGASKASLKHVLLFDIPLLPVHQSALWTAACLLQIRSMHPLAKVARRRKRTYKSVDQAVKSFGRTAFFKSWPEERIRTYIEANFEHHGEKIDLLHDPLWEADIFEAMPANAFSAMRRLPAKNRKKMNIVLVVGTRSEVCQPTWNRYVNLFFPHVRRVEMEGGHMFPFEHEKKFLDLLPALTPE